MTRPLALRLIKGSKGSRSVNTVESERDAFFRRLYDEHHAHVRKTLYWMLPRNPALDDLVQETFVKIWKNLSDFREESGLRTWIHRIAVNVAYDHLRRTGRQMAREKESEESIVAAHSSGSDVLLQKTLEDGLHAIPPKQRVIFVLYYQQELSISEISQALGIPQGTIKSRLHHARRAFTEFLERKGVKL